MPGTRVSNLGSVMSGSKLGSAIGGQSSLGNRMSAMGSKMGMSRFGSSLGSTLSNRIVGGCPHCNDSGA